LEKESEAAGSKAEETKREQQEDLQKGVVISDLKIGEKSNKCPDQ